MAKGDNFVRNHCVPKGHEDIMLLSEDAIQIQFQRLVTVENQTKYCRATINCSHKIMMEIIDKYGLNDIITSRWTIWQAGKNGTKGKNIPFSSG